MSCINQRADSQELGGVRLEGGPAFGPDEHPAQATTYYDAAFVALNRDMEAKFRSGQISFNSFDWHLRSICGV
jgi:hypothetical protein